MICKKCGEENNEQYEFCTGCGASMKASLQEPTATLPDSRNESGARRKLEQAELLVGQTLDGKYHLNSVIGVGGMGAVYNATRLKIGDEVAVKILHPERVDSQSAERFKREAQMAARLKHPNAVTIFDFDVSEGDLLYLVMELVAGQSLRQIVKQQRILPLQTVSVITELVCAALDEAHRQGIIHRDIKPDNIIVNAMPNGLRVKVLDFGLAKLFNISTSDLTQTGVVIGTPRYMSPEQCMGEEIDGRSDIYSFGIVLYEMLGGAAPFDAPTSTAVAVQHVTKQPPPLRSLNPNIPPSVEAVVMRSLQKQKEARQQTAAALAQELHSSVYGTSGASQAYFSGGFSPSANASTSENLVMPSAPTVFSTPMSGRQAVASPADSINKTIAAPDFGASFGYTTPERNNSKLPLIIGAALAFIFLSVIVGAVVWWQMQKSDEQASGNQNLNQNLQVRANTNTPANSVSNSNSSNFNSSPNSPADDEFTRLQSKLETSTPAQKKALDSELKNVEDKYPNDYRFTYQRAKLETVSSKEHHEAFEMLFGAGEKAIKADKSTNLLGDLQRDKDLDLKRLISHKEWTTLENALRNKDAKTLEVKEH